MDNFCQGLKVIAALGGPCPLLEETLSSGAELQTYLVSYFVSLAKQQRVSSKLSILSNITFLVHLTA